jgi:hypothetical protein
MVTAVAVATTITSAMRDVRTVPAAAVEILTLSTN